jgi:tocopherol cyclase
MKTKIFLTTIALLFPLFTFAKNNFDAFNAYRWNRHNHDKKKIAIDTSDWYEWWYYKVYDPKTGAAFFFTYGVVNPWDDKGTLGGTRAIVQVGNFDTKNLTEKIYPLNQFSARYDATEVMIGNNLATDKRIYGQYTDDTGQNVSWDLHLDKQWTFDAMAWGMRARKVSGIYWYPAQASATMSGWINFHGKIYRFDSAPAYQDRNWGQSFPKWWTWLVSNHFKNSPGTALAAGGGVPKIFNKVAGPAGLCIGLFHNGKEYAFRTTHGDTIKFDIRWGVWEIQAENHQRQRIEISAYAPREKFMNLPFYTPRGEVFNDYEALTGQLKVKLYERQYVGSKWKLITELETDAAGIEWGSPDPLDFESLFSFGVTLN